MINCNYLDKSNSKSRIIFKNKLSKKDLKANSRNGQSFNQFCANLGPIRQARN